MWNAAITAKNHHCLVVFVAFLLYVAKYNILFIFYNIYILFVFIVFYYIIVISYRKVQHRKCLIKLKVCCDQEFGDTVCHEREVMVVEV